MWSVFSFVNAGHCSNNGVKLMTKHFRNLINLLIFLVATVMTASAMPAADTSSADMNTVVPQPHPPGSYWVKQLPDGNGRDLVARRCGLCHNLQRAVAFSRPKETWEEIVRTMMRRGAPVQPDEFPIIVDYLTENFGPTSEPRGIIGMQPCKQIDWPQGSAYFRAAVHASYSIWASDQQGGTVDIIDPSQNKVVRRIRCISGADRVEFSPDGNIAYIPDRIEHDITIVDTRTGAILKKIPVVARPNVAVLSRDGKTLFAGIWPVRPDEDKRGYIEVIDTAKLEVVKVIETKGAIHDIWMAKDGKTFLAMAPEAKFMNLYDTQTQQLIYTCCTDATIGTMDMERSPDGSTGRFFLSYEGFPGIVVINAKTGKEIERVRHPVDKDGPFAGVESTHGFHGNEISPDGKSFWCIAYNIVFRYSLPELKPLGHIHLAEVDQTGQPFKPSTEGTWLTISPDGTTVYAARPGRDLISVIDVATMTETTRIPTGEYPLHISIWPRGTP